MDDQVLGIAEARASLSHLVDRVSSNDLDRVIIGSHRKPEAMIVRYQREPSPSADGPVLDQLRRKADLVKRLAALSKIESIAVFGSVARGEERSDSDIDLMVNTLPDASLFDIARFEMDMELLFDRSVSVLDRSALDRVRDRLMFNDAVAL